MNLERVQSATRIIYPTIFTASASSESNNKKDSSDLLNSCINSDANSLVFLPDFYVEKRGQLCFFQPGMSCVDNYFPFFSGQKNLAKSNNLIFLQLSHAGIYSSSLVTGEFSYAFSPLKKFPFSREMTKEEIRTLPIMFARAGLQAKKLGFNGVEINIGDGLLLTQVISTEYNFRNDEFGGSIQNRIRLIKEVILAIRNICGFDFLLAIHFSLHCHGILLDENTISFILTELKNLPINVFILSTDAKKECFYSISKIKTSEKSLMAILNASADHYKNIPVIQVNTKQFVGQDNFFSTRCKNCIGTLQSYSEKSAGCFFYKLCTG